MVGQSLTVPPPSDDDHEDVAWALRAASAQWRRDDRKDAVAWVRRAAETAIEVGQAVRARELFLLAQRLEHGPVDSGPGMFGGLPGGVVPGSVPPVHTPPPARMAVAPPMRAPAILAGPVEADVDDLEFDDDSGLEDEEIVFDDEVEQLEPGSNVLSARGVPTMPSSFPSSVPSQAMPPSVGPALVPGEASSRSLASSYPTSVPPNPWAPGASSRPPPAGAPSLPALPSLPSLPSPVRQSSGPEASRPASSGPVSSGRGGFDTAFLDSLDEDAPLPSFGSQPDLDFGEEPPTRQASPPSMVELPLPALSVASKLPIDQATAAEYAQRSRGRPVETPEDIEQELGVDLSVGSTKPPPPDFRPSQDLSPTPGRASVRPSGPPTVVKRVLGHEPFALAPSASMPPVRLEPPSRPTQAPPPESMSEPERHDSSGPEPEFDITGQVHPDRSSAPPPSSMLPAITEDDDDVLAGAFERLQSRPPPVAQVQKVEVASVAAVPALERKPAAPAPHAVDGIDLLEAKGLQDLPEDAMAELARRAQVVALGPGEEVASFGVALVTSGSVQLMPTVADASCARASRGEVVFTRGTVPSSVALRVVGAEPGTRVAILSDADLDAVTSSCPWVRDELAEVGDRFNAFGGAVLGPLGEALDEMFRAMVLEKCVVKNPAPGTLIAHRKQAMDGMYVLGAGALLVLAEDGKVESELSPGDFVFPETVLGGSPARADVRVAKGGALLLYAGRMAAHELLATCPPFIEILAG